MVCYQCLLTAWCHFRRSKALIVSSNTSFLFETLMWKRHLSGPSLAGREIRDSSLTLPVGQKLRQEIFNLAKPERKAHQYPMAHQIPMMNSYVPIYNIHIYYNFDASIAENRINVFHPQVKNPLYSGLARRFPTTHPWLFNHQQIIGLVKKCILVILWSGVPGFIRATWRHPIHQGYSQPSDLECWPCWHRGQNSEPPERGVS